jgi:1-deoxy-D-xylulose-5-phosphate reductoisomerase
MFLLTGFRWSFIRKASFIRSFSTADGSVIAELGNPDMRTPIAHALAYPQRIAAGVEPLDLYQVASLHFARPDLERFPCLALAYRALGEGGSAPTTLNAANEVAVEAFLERRIGFTAIPEVIAEVMDQLPLASPLDSLADVLAADRGRGKQPNVV